MAHPPFRTMCLSADTRSAQEPLRVRRSPNHSAAGFAHGAACQLGRDRTSGATLIAYDLFQQRLDIGDIALCPGSRSATPGVTAAPRADGIDDRHHLRVQPRLVQHVA
jgi:hypothetical protein